MRVIKLTIGDQGECTTSSTGSSELCGQIERSRTCRSDNHLEGWVRNTKGDEVGVIVPDQPLLVSFVRSHGASASLPRVSRRAEIAQLPLLQVGALPRPRSLG